VAGETDRQFASELTDCLSVDEFANELTKNCLSVDEFASKLTRSNCLSVDEFCFPPNRAGDFNSFIIHHSSIQSNTRSTSNH
jgi:hypothetical protein